MLGKTEGHLTVPHYDGHSDGFRDGRVTSRTAGALLRTSAGITGKDMPPFDGITSSESCSA